ncbi:dipeptidase [Terrimonas pollutisoli]|uniref:dipeptidase n=1 Tax=Terrimonas pollutisoli TaxID=3034147 RepID=UPI0023EB7C8E|nr:dipeptidase [Terrimonas sp. H1YJ31]
MVLISFSNGYSQAYKKLHSKAVLVDTHNDVLSSAVLDGKDISHRIGEGHSDLDRFKAGGVDVQFFSVFTGPEPRNKEGVYKDANEEIDSLESIVARNKDKMVLAKTYADTEMGISQGKLVALVGVEGGHMIEGDLQKLEALYKRGMRYMTLTWNNSTDWASSAMDEASLNPSEGGTLKNSKKRKGLTDFGKQIVRRMNELGIIVDLSHTGEQTFYDAIAISSKPVLLSHSSVWNLCPVFRNVKDDQLKALKRNGGVICINFYSGFISKAFDERSEYFKNAAKNGLQDSLFKIYKDSATMKTRLQEYSKTELEKIRPTIADLVDHIDYVVKLIGDDHVGIGADYDGVSSLPVGMDDVTSYPKITEELMRRGYSKKSIKKILGKNVLRVMKENF